MRTEPQPICFEDLVDEVRNSVCATWPTVRGGVWSDEAKMKERLGAFKGQSALGWRIWETTDSCAIGRDWFEEQDQASRDNWRWLERARLFGEGGDLDVRRDGERFLWRYVGERDHAPPGRDELKPDGSSPVYCREQTALLWGTRRGNQKQWFDDRVSGASLTYFPDPSALPESIEERVGVKIREYTQAGRTLVVWLLGLETIKTEEEGDG